MSLMEILRLLKVNCPRGLGRLSGIHLVVLAEVLPVLSVCLLLSHHYHERYTMERKETVNNVT